MKFMVIQAVHAAYAFATTGNRIRPVIRYMLASFSGIASLIPEQGRLLDVGCGDGLLAVYLKKIKGRVQSIVGVDIDERKIRIAEQLALPGVTFHHKDVAAMPANSFDIVSVVHVLYLIPAHLREQFVQHCVRVLKPGGTLVLAINMATPRWKYWVTYLQELIMVKLLSLTKGQAIRFSSMDECKAWIHQAGARLISVKPLGKGRPYAHVGLVAKKILDVDGGASVGHAL